MGRKLLNSYFLVYAKLTSIMNIQKRRFKAKHLISLSPLNS